MELKKLDRKVLKLWYIRAAFLAAILLGAVIGTLIILNLAEVQSSIITPIMACISVVAFIIIAFILIMPSLRYKMYGWNYDDKTIVVKQGVIFRSKVVIPVCQIQDLHRFEGPIMMLMKLSGVTISTAGSNFNLSTLTTEEADVMIKELKESLEKRIEEHRNETI